MSPLPADVIGDAYENGIEWDVLTDLVEVGGRMAGENGEEAGATIVETAFEESGLRNVDTNEFAIDGWSRGSSSVRIDDRTFDLEHEVIALPGTTAGEVTATLVDLGYGRPEAIGSEVEGNIVMVRSDVPDEYGRWVHRIEKYAEAVRQGAVGFVFRNHVDGQLPPTGEIGWGRRPSPIPAVGVSAELGGRLAQYADSAPTATLSVECWNGSATSVNVEGTVGPDTDEMVVVSAHVDGHDISDGARDNAAGSALVAEIGRLLTAVEDDLETTVRLVTFGAEEIGLLGSHQFASVTDHDSIKCVLNIDGAGDSRTPSVRSYGYDVMTDIIRDVTDDLGVPLEVRDQISPHSDAWPFAEVGIPAVTAGSVTDDSGRGWGHTHADTLDKIDPRDMRELAIIYANVALELATNARHVPHVSRQEYREQVGDHIERELTFFDRWSHE
ncbi:M28 family peptidase [Salinadaptatus halalkaliphilus]|uniref:Carboxypeptidase Q n=1 Tax=Salinadaptatus halalkaliphilus TaxID=2419781 RepID=A0A4S3TJU5_9EURY|nr:M28 family metallopeptidase [Salinadaptatus halalkaliphilus]THE63165.1 M28 family peptidase [Salinadaptatus halalkaliphilus]